MSKLSIRLKIIAVIALLLVVMSGMGVLALRSMQGINARTVDISTNWLPSVRVLGNLRADINVYRLTLRAHVMALTPEAKANNDKRMADVFDKVKKDIKAYQPLISTAEERSIYESWTRAWDKYTAEAEKVLEVSRKSIGKLPDDVDALFKPAGAAAAAQEEILTKAIDYNDKGAETATRDAADSYNVTFWVVTSIILGALAAGVGVGFYLVHDVSSGIASIIKPMQALGEGDLAAEVPHRGEPTEMGAMADTLQVFKEALIAKREADALAARDAEAKIERSPASSRIRSVRSCRQCPRRPPSSSIPPARCRRRRHARSRSRPRSQPPRRKPRPMCNRSPRPPRSCHHRSPRSAARCRNRRAWRRRPSRRHARPTIASANCRRPRPASATSSS